MSTEYRNIGKELYDAADNKNLTRILHLLSDPAFSASDVKYEQYFQEGSQTALYKASTKGSFDIVKALVNAGSDVNAVCYNKFTPITTAAKNGHFQIVKLLYRHGANPYIKNKFRDDAFSSSKKNKNSDIYEFLQEQEEAKKRLADVREVAFTEDFENYKLEEIYHFNRLIRVSVLRDKSNGTFSFQRDEFKDIQNQSGLQKAFNEHVKRGGKTPEQDVFPDRVIKSKTGILYSKRKLS